MAHCPHGEWYPNTATIAPSDPSGSPSSSDCARFVDSPITLSASLGYSPSSPEIASRPQAPVAPYPDPYPLFRPPVEPFSPHSHHYDTPAEVHGYSYDDDDNVHLCQWGGPGACGERLEANNRAIRAHLRAAHGVPGADKDTRIQCRWGGSCTSRGSGDTVRPGGMWKHIATCHLKTLRRRCAKCKKGFCREDSLRRHQLLYCPDSARNAPGPYTQLIPVH